MEQAPNCRCSCHRPRRGISFHVSVPFATSRTSLSVATCIGKQFLNKLSQNEPVLTSGAFTDTLKAHREHGEAAFSRSMETLMLCTHNTAFERIASHPLLILYSCNTFKFCFHSSRILLSTIEKKVSALLDLKATVPVGEITAE